MVEKWGNDVSEMWKLHCLMCDAPSLSEGEGEVQEHSRMRREAEQSKHSLSLPLALAEPETPREECFLLGGAPEPALGFLTRTSQDYSFFYIAFHQMSLSFFLLVKAKLLFAAEFLFIRR